MSPPGAPQRYVPRREPEPGPWNLRESEAGVGEGGCLEIGVGGDVGQLSSLYRFARITLPQPNSQPNLTMTPGTTLSNFQTIGSIPL